MYVAVMEWELVSPRVVFCTFVLASESRESLEKRLGCFSLSGRPVKWPVHQMATYCSFIIYFEQVSECKEAKGKSDLKRDRTLPPPIVYLS